MRDFLGQDIKADQLVRWLGTLAAGIAVLAILAGLLLWRAWQIRGDLEDTGWQEARIASEPGEAVTVIWLGTSTLLFDDGETQVLIDGNFTRVRVLDILLFRRVNSDVATINYALASYGMTRLAAIVPVHSHFDHAMDVGRVANRTTAVVLGSESTANIVRGANVPVDQYQILGDGEIRQFGDFTIKLLESRHVPLRPNDTEFFAGKIESTLRQPARVSDYRTGVAWSVLLGHPRGTTLIQGSGGFIEDKLAAETADVVMLSIAGLADQGKDYVAELWREVVTKTGASRVIINHHDDYTLPFGEVRPFPNLADNVVRTSAWINQLAAAEPKVSVELPPFGKPVFLY